MGSATSAEYHATETLKGGIGEVLIFNKPLNYDDKWRIYAYLLSKWFNYTVLDALHMTTDTRLMAASAAHMVIDQDIKNAIPDPTIFKKGI